MAGWDRYRAGVVDEVFRELGAEGVRPVEAPASFAWVRRRGAHTTIMVWRPATGAEGMGADEIEYFARRLGLDPVRVFALLDGRGGKILDA